jgi:hypothetical protein
VDPPRLVPVARPLVLRLRWCLQPAIAALAIGADAFRAYPMLTKFPRLILKTYPPFAAYGLISDVFWWS